MTKNLTLLGNQNTVYKDDYAPEVLETFDNKHPENDYFVNLIALNLLVYAPLQGNLILLLSILVMFLIKRW